MYTIALIAQKGGTGKTTLAVHVAADFEGAGGSAALVDLDPQASAALWGDRRGRSPFVGAVPAARLEAALAAARRSGALAAARAADLALVPLRPGLFDIAALDATARLCTLASLPFAVVLNHVPAAGQDDGSRRGRRARLRGRGRALPAPGPFRGEGVPPQQGGWRDPRLRSVAAPPHGRPKCLRLATPSRACSRAPTARPSTSYSASTGSAPSRGSRHGPRDARRNPIQTSTPVALPTTQTVRAGRVRSQAGRSPDGSFNARRKGEVSGRYHLCAVDRP